jgi:transposase
MDRLVLSDAQWAKMEPLCLGKPSDRGRSGKDNRLFVEAVLWIARTGSPWRDLPPSFGHWNSTFTRFRAGPKPAFSSVCSTPSRMIPTWNTPCSMPPSSSPPPWAGCKRGTSNQAIGRSKILALTDALGNLVRFELLPGQRFDTIGVPPLIEGVEFGALIADKAFDANAIIADLDTHGAKVVISQHSRRTSPRRIDEEMYKWRHLIENFFCKLKEFKRIAMRADKTDQRFAALIQIAAVIASR